jgi:hypothetical protein
MTETSTITCPKCGHQAIEQMPTHACQFFYDCVANGLSRSRAIVACSALTDRRRVHPCRVDVAATSTFALLRHLAAFNRVKVQRWDGERVPNAVLMFSYKRLRSLWWRWHPLEVGNILWRLVPCGPTLRVDDGLSGKPIVLVETSYRYAYYTGPP